MQPDLLWRGARLLCWLLDRPVKLAQRAFQDAPLPLAAERLGKIVVQFPNWLGDAVMSLALLHHLRVVCPAASIAVVSRPGWADLWQGLPHVDKVIRFDRFDEQLTLADIRQFIAALREFAADAAFILPGGIEFALFYAWAGVRVRIGYSFDHRHLLLTHPLRVPPQFRRRHLSESYLDLGRGLGPAAAGRPQLGMPRANGRSGGAMSAPFPQSAGFLRVLLHPWSTYGPAKRWPATRFAELGTRIAERYRAEIVLVGTAEARTVAMEINRLMNHRARDLTGRTSIVELCQLIRESALVISNDSGPAHLADALGVPLVVLFGSSSPVWTAPRGERSEVVYRSLKCSPCFKRQCPFGTSACFEAITTDEVFARVERLLAGGDFSQRVLA